MSEIKTKQKNSTCLCFTLRTCYICDNGTISIGRLIVVEITYDLG